MNSNKGIIVQLLKNKSNDMYYKAVANSLLFMWSPAARSWIKPCTTYSDMMQHIDEFEAISDSESARLAREIFI